MENVKDKIFDFVYDELDEDQKESVWQEITKSQELFDYYQQLKAKAALLDKSLFEEVDDDLLEAQRELLLERITVTNNDRNDKLKKVSLGNVFPLIQKLFNVAAVVLITFFVTQRYYDNGKKSDVGDMMFSTDAGSGTGSITPVSFQGGGEVYPSSDDYSYKNLVIDDDGSNMKLSFDISTRKVIEGRKDDPVIVYTLNKILRGNNDPGVKLRTMKAIDSTGDEKLQATLIFSMLRDENPVVRKKALKVLTRGTINDKIKDALLAVIERDEDQILRIEALNVLEKVDGKVAYKALKMVEDDDNEYLHYRASLIDE